VHANATIIGTFHPFPFVRLREDLISFITAELARRYQTEGINAYVNLIQNKERELGIDIITHQKWFAPSIDYFLSSHVG